MDSLEFRSPDSKEFDYIRQLIKNFNLEERELKEEEFIMAKYKSRFAGFARLKVHPDCVEISNVGVLPQYRKKGIGRNLVQKLLEKSESDKVYIITAIPDYFKNMGFREEKEIPKTMQSKLIDCHKKHNPDVVRVMVI